MVLLPSCCQKMTVLIDNQYNEQKQLKGEK
jgi:hypothetical protein